MLAIACCACTLCVVFDGCAHVAPYEREYLTRPGMDTGREAFAEGFVVHVRASREGGMESADSAGGGCGCN